MTVMLKVVLMVKAIVFMIRVMTITQVLSEAAVVFGTLTGCAGDSLVAALPKGHFSLTVVDECGQAMEAAVWGVVRYCLCHVFFSSSGSSLFQVH